MTLEITSGASDGPAETQRGAQPTTFTTLCKLFVCKRKFYLCVCVGTCVSGGSTHVTKEACSCPSFSKHSGNK